MTTVKNMKIQTHVDKLENVIPLVYITKYKSTCPWTFILYANNQQLLNDLKINKYILISAKDIKCILKKYNGKNNKQNEPRLLCYQISSKRRPDIFRRLHLYILPVSNGNYIIQYENIYEYLNYSINSNIIELPLNNGSDLLKFGDSESNRLNFAYYSSIFSNIIGEKIMYSNILNGRHRTPEFDIVLNNVNVNVKGVQYEIDSLYESKNKIIIVEAKNEKKQVTSFNIKQIYYPYRSILKNIRKIKSEKEIVLLFFHFLNGIYYIWEYKFLNILKLNSIYLHKFYKYVLN
jgi:hypothetical protein